MATQAAIAAFREAYSEPDIQTSEFVTRRSHLRLLWGYYQSTSFDNVSQWQKYREAYTLYRNIRTIYNPTRRLVNFYVAQVYPGVLSEDASALPDGVQLAIPLASDTPEELKMAVSQFWQWANWQIGNKKMVRYGAISGGALVELIDDVARGKIATAIRWPGLVKDLELDHTGNVKSYSLEYDVRDGDDSFTYRKEVDGESYRYFKDDSPFTPEGREASAEENLYGFVPAVWCKHIDEGLDWGAPAIAGSIGKIDEVNGLASHTHDLVDRQIEAPGIIATDGNIGKIGDKRAGTSSEESAAVTTVREKNANLLILKGPKDTAWHPMASSLDPSEVVPLIERALVELEHDFPELSMYTELRKMSQVTGPGAARMMGDVYGKVLEVASNYDLQSIKLFQMACAIGGFRLKEGREGWRSPNAQQRKFGSFDLESYFRGELDMAILPRPLVPMTEADQIELTAKRLDNAVKAEGLFSEDKRLEIAGVSDPGERGKILNQRASVDVTVLEEQ